MEAFPCSSLFRFQCSKTIKSVREESFSELLSERKDGELQGWEERAMRREEKALTREMDCCEGESSSNREKEMWRER